MEMKTHAHTRKMTTQQSKTTQKLILDEKLIKVLEIEQI